VDEGVALFHKGDDFDIAEALRALGRAAEAAAAYDRFLEETDADSREVAGQRRTARSELDGLEHRLGRIALVIEPDEPAREVKLDGLAATVRPGRPVYVAPGRHVVEVTAPGYRPVRTEVAVSAGELRDLAVALGREAAVTPPAARKNDELMVERPAPAPRRRRLWTWVAASAAAGLLGGGVFFGVRAGSAYDEYRTTDSPERYDQLRDQIRRDSLAANLLFAGGGVAAIGSAILFAGEF